MQVSVGQAACMLGVSVTTLRRWEKAGKLTPDSRTFGGHRRYLVTHLEKVTTNTSKLEQNLKTAVAYGRVSSSDQKSDLMTQEKKLTAYCEANFPRFQVICDLGSGLNFKKPGLKKLLRLIFLGQVSHLVLNHKDRLLRFGAEIVFEYCQHFGVKVVILEETLSQNFEEELVNDVIQLMTVFSAKLYGKRSHQNRKAMAA